MGLRFLNFNNHVQATTSVNFMRNFKSVLEQLSQVTSMQELQHLTQRFFKESFGTPINKTLLYIRVQGNGENRLLSMNNETTALAEAFMITHEKDICRTLKNQKILINDEISFTNFYEETETSKALIHFLNTINADIFIPIYEKDQLIAYIIIDRYARLEEFYSDVERDEMLVFASYLGNIINLLHNKNIDALIHHEKELREELYQKHQEVNQYKESIRSFLRSSKQKEIGIIFYKNRRFIFGNQAAKEFIDINVHMQEGHPLTKALKKVAQRVEQYKAPQNTFAKDNNGTTIVLSAVPHLDQNNVIITVYYPDVSDIVKKQIDMLADPSEWDYLLYLETTKPGKLVNQLIPSSGEAFLNFKINLLKAALSKKATLLSMPESDLMPTVELIHHISLRETLYVMDIQPKSNSAEIATKLFGVNPLFSTKEKYEKPLLEKLDTTGTLFIKNIDLLDIEIQEHLAEFIRYGLYRVFKSDQRIPSNVRIICSSYQNLAHLVQQGTFSKALYDELHKTTLSMPSLLTLPEQEFNALADSFTEQAVHNQAFRNLLNLSEKDKHKLAHNRPASLHEFKDKVRNMLMQKSHKSTIVDSTHFDPAYDITDPELIHAARLGKQALKDQQIMVMLWNKFGNQNKIATFLGVNRSSVNRRCKEYNLQ